MWDSRSLVIEEVQFDVGNRGWVIRRQPEHPGDQPLAIIGEDSEGFVAQGIHLYWADTLEEAAVMALLDYLWITNDLLPESLQDQMKRRRSPAAGPTLDDEEFWEMVG